MAEEQQKRTCIKCGRLMLEKEFYTKKNGEKTDMCKKCLTMHVDCWDPDTFTWILKEIDVPYIPQEWNVLRDKAYKEKKGKMSGTAVMGKYLSKMHLTQFKQFTWADSEKILEQLKETAETRKEAQKQFEKELKEQLAKGEISEAQYKTYISTETQHEEDLQAEIGDTVGAKNVFNEDNFMSEEELFNYQDELTQEDKIMLATKWGRLYQPHEWVFLEQHYREMEQGFDIQDPDSINTLKILSKTYLKMNQAIDSGDIDTYQKLSRVYDSLRKSSKFTAAQKKEEKEDAVDCVGNLVAYCESHGGKIPRYEIEEPKDKVDIIIKDLKRYTKDLIYEDTALARQIEDYLKKREILDQEARDEAKRRSMTLEEEQEEAIISDEDHIAFLADEEKQRKADNDQQGEAASSRL